MDRWGRQTDTVKVIRLQISDWGHQQEKEITLPSLAPANERYLCIFALHTDSTFNKIKGKEQESDIAEGEIRDRKREDVVKSSGECVVLDEIGYVEGHFVNLCVVELFNIPEHPDILRRYKVYSNTFATEPTATTNAVDIILSVCR
jgi:hypothetical protein